MMTKEEIKNLSMVEIDFLMRDLQEEKDRRDKEVYKTLVQDVLSKVAILEGYGYGSIIAFEDENDCYFWKDLYEKISKELRCNN